MLLLLQHFSASVFSALVRIKTMARNQRKIEDDIRLAVSVKRPTTGFEVGHTVAKSTVALKMFVKSYCRLNLNVMKCVFVVIML